MNIVRQYVAMSITFAGFHFIIKKQYWKYILVIIIAAQFHKTAIFMLPIIFFIKVKFPMWVLLPTVILTFLIGNVLMMHILRMFSTLVISDVSGSNLSEYYLRMQDVSAVGTGLYRVFINMLAIGTILISKKLKNINPNINIYANMIVFSVVIYNIFMLFQSAMRLSWYLFIFVIVFIPIVINYFDKYSKIFITTILVIVFCAFTFMSLNSEAFYYNINTTIKK
jgi:hypothetical protein